MRHIFERYIGGSWVEMTGIKNVRYRQQANKNGVLKLGNVIASSVEVEYYIESQTDLQVGEVIRYRQGYDVDLINFSPITPERKVMVNFFWVDSFSKGKKTATFVAYDIIKKLDVDYSARMLANKANFPMSVADLLTDLQTFTGVSILQSGTIGVKNALVNYFYVEGLTARDVLGAIYELLGRDAVALFTLGSDPSSAYITQKMYAGNEGSIVSYRYGANKYIVSPTDQQTYIVDGVTLVPIFYKENGLEVGDDASDPVDCVQVIKSDGTILGSYSSGTDNNICYIKNNIVAEYIESFADAYALSQAYGGITSVDASPKVKAHLFPFRFPFVAHGITYFADTDGTIKPFPIMNLEWTNQEVIVESYGASVQQYDDYDTQNAESQTQTLSAVVNGLRDQVGQNSSDISDLSTIVGDGILDPNFTATDITGAVNELENGKVSNSDLPLSVANGGTGANNASDALKNLKACDLDLGVAIESGDDLDDYTTPGTYYSVNATLSASLSNTPVTNQGFKLLVMYTNNSLYPTQLLSAYNGDIYRRAKVNTGWKAWEACFFCDKIIDANFTGTGTTDVVDALNRATLPSAPTSFALQIGSTGAACKVLLMVALLSSTSGSAIATSPYLAINGTKYRLASGTWSLQT